MRGCAASFRIVPSSSLSVGSGGIQHQESKKDEQHGGLVPSTFTQRYIDFPFTGCGVACVLLPIWKAWSLRNGPLSVAVKS